MGDETCDPEHQSEGDNKEGLYFGRDLPADCEEARKPMHGPNQWPDAVVLPDFAPVISAYFDAVRVTNDGRNRASTNDAFDFKPATLPYLLAGTCDQLTK